MTPDPLELDEADGFFLPPFGGGTTGGVTTGSGSTGGGFAAPRDFGAGGVFDLLVETGIVEE